MHIQTAIKPGRIRPTALVHQLIEEQVLLHPGAVAVVAEDQSLSYAQLNESANRLANFLISKGVGPEELVGICVERSLDMTICILGVLKAGGAYVPLDPSYPKNRLDYMLEDSKASIIITEQNLAGTFSNVIAPVIIFDAQADEISKESDIAPVISQKPENLAYVIYTSGTTGEPKGVMITHGSLSNYVRELPQAVGLKQADRYLHSASISFSSSVRQLMAPLSIGATVVIATTDRMGDPKALFELIHRQRITVLDFVPTFWRSCLTMLESLDTEVSYIDSVRLMLSASEALPLELANAISSRFKADARLVNMFGQTETTGIISVSHIEKEIDDNTRIAPIGRPIGNTQVYILDGNLEPLPVGVAGEMHIGGAGLARGYLNQPELTAERFIRDPIEASGEGRLYKTGDLARYQANGEIEYLGRIDDQVKIRGFRIELGEIEAVLLQHGDVREAVVVAREDEAGDKRLAGYVVAKGRKGVDIGEIRRYLKTKLPEHMVPSQFAALERLPLTPNGKVDRKALPEIGRSGGEEREGYEAPRDETEEKLAGIWGEVLGVEKIGVRENFFELGGHSLKAVRMFTVVEETFKKNIPLATLFEAGTIERLAEIIRMEGWEEPESSIVAIQPKGTKPPFFCIHAKGGNVLFYK
ncbi:MAG: non-ribosomal peptide synthetase, partial [Blastocatellia bacterium]